MGTGGISFLSSGVWLIPLTLLAVVGALYLLARRLEHQTKDELKELRGELRRLQAARQQVERTAQQYSPEDPEPYGRRAASLFGKLGQLVDQANNLEYQHVAIRENLHQLASNPMRMVMGAPFFGPTLRKSLARLRQDLESAWRTEEEASALEQALDRISWDVAVLARQMRQLERQAGSLIERLRAQDVGGQAIETATEQDGRIQATLSELPAHFLEGDEATVLEKAGPDDTIAAYTLLAGIQPELDQLSANAQAWEKLVAEANDKVAILRRLLDELEQTLENMPAGLELEPFKEQFKQIKIIAQNLHNTLSRLEIESVEMVIQETTRLTRLAQDMGGQLRRARRELPALEGVLGELSAGSKELSAQVSDLGKRSVHPVLWRPSLDALTELNRQIHRLGPVQKPRTPEQVGQELAQAAELRLRQKELAQNYQKIEQTHAELLELLAGAEFKGAEQRLGRAQELVEQIQTYAPDNWPRQDAISSLPGEIERMAQGFQRLLPSVPEEPIPEVALARRLEETRQLAGDYQRLGQRIDQAATRLAEIESSEKLAQETLKNAQASFNQIAFIIRSNNFLTSIAAPEASRFQASLQEQLDDLAQRQRGSVEKKSRQAEALVAKIEAAANQWLDRLNQETQATHQALSTALAQLDAIAVLDEPTLAEARRLLDSAPAMSGFGAKSRFRLDELLPEFKRRSDYGQACAAAERALEDVAGPVMDTYEEAGFNRQQARELLAELSNRVRQERAWPPTTVTLEAEHQELEKAERQWRGLKGDPIRAISLVQQLGSLSARYQTLAEKLHQGGERLAQEQAQVEDIETEIDELAQYWESQWQTYRDNPTASQEIRALLDSSDQQQSQLKRQYRQGAKSYNQIVQELKALQRKLKYFQAALDDDHAIDSGGRVHTRR